MRVSYWPAALQTIVVWMPDTAVLDVLTCLALTDRQTRDVAIVAFTAQFESVLRCRRVSAGFKPDRQKEDAAHTTSAIIRTDHAPGSTSNPRPAARTGAH